MKSGPAGTDYEGGPVPGRRDFTSGDGNAFEQVIDSVLFSGLDAEIALLIKESGGAGSHEGGEGAADLVG